jgi:glyoxylase-like metal-dependent hydrolase (beta-lactamase superfamily II)
MSPAGADAVIRLTLGTNNVYALPSGAGVTLIDAGPDYAGAWDELLAQLALHGITPDVVHTVLLTHAHLDHAGLAARWQAAGSRILIGRGDAAALALDGAAYEEERALARRELLRHGVPPGALAVRPARGERYTRWPAPLRTTPVHADGILDHGACAGDRSRPLRVIVCPGHTPGTLLFLDRQGGALFTGDHILPRMAPTSGIQFDGPRRRPSLPTYLASLHAARPLAGHVAVTMPGHGEPIDDLGEAVDWTIRLLEKRANRLLVRLRQAPGTAYALALRLFPHLGPRHLRAVIAECIGLLDLLAERGQATADESTEPVVWRSL